MGERGPEFGSRSPEFKPQPGAQPTLAELLEQFFKVVADANLEPGDHRYEKVASLLAVATYSEGAARSLLELSTLMVNIG